MPRLGERAIAGQHRSGRESFLFSLFGDCPVIVMFTSSKHVLFDSCSRILPIKWQRVLEHSRIMRSLLTKVLLMVQDKLSKETCIALHLYCREVSRLVRRSGLLFTALYLKQCSASLQTAYGGIKRPHELLPVPVSLNRSGYPRIIPAFHRRIIMQKNDRSDELVKLYLSFFSLYRIIKRAKKISYTSTFKSIVEPTDLEAASEWCSEFRDELLALVRRYIPFVSEIPLHQGISWEPTWKSLPTHRRVNQLMKEVLAEKLKIGPRVVSCFPALLFEMNAFSFLMERVHVSEGHWSQGCLWPACTRYALDPASTALTNWCLDQFERVTGPQLPTYHELQEPPICGRLGQSIEGGGKRRIFAIGNYVNQRLLKPVHDWLMAVLRRIPTDGTFNQEQPLERLVGEVNCFSFDLKSATDRWPLQTMFEVLQCLFDRSFASSVRSALALNLFEVPFVRRPNSTVSFVCGQPLGYYSSWPLFALSHHAMVWWCAEKVYPGVKFTRYGILGDDVVIADRKVAAMYEQTLSRINVGISYQKSLISDTGAAEFAKRLRVRGLTKDISPVSVRALLNFYNPFGLLALGLRYKCKRLSTLARIGGCGYKQLAKFDRPDQFNVRLARLQSMHMAALLGRETLELWLGGGLPLNPYLRQVVWKKLTDHLRPKELRRAPEELFVTPKVDTFQEYTTLRSWVSQWTRYCHWYYTVALDPWVKLGSLFDGPVCTTTWQATEKDETLLRFGMLWKMYDLVRRLGFGYRPPILSSDPSGEQSPGWLLGGRAGSNFLVQSRGLVQPRAGRGVVVPGVELNPAKPDPRLTLVHYKTLGVSDRQSVLDFDRPSWPRVCSDVRAAKIPCRTLEDEAGL